MINPSRHTLVFSSFENLLQAVASIFDEDSGKSAMIRFLESVQQHYEPTELADPKWSGDIVAGSEVAENMFRNFDPSETASLTQ